MALLRMSFVPVPRMGRGVMPGQTPEGLTLVLRSATDIAMGALLAPFGGKIGGQCVRALARAAVLSGGATRPLW